MSDRIVAAQTDRNGSGFSKESTVTDPFTEPGGTEHLADLDTNPLTDGLLARPSTDGRPEADGRPESDGPEAESRPETDIRPENVEEEGGIGRRVVVFANLGLSSEASPTSRQAISGVAND